MSVQFINGLNFHSVQKQQKPAKQAQANKFGKTIAEKVQDEKSQQGNKYSVDRHMLTAVASGDFPLVKYLVENGNPSRNFINLELFSTNDILPGESALKIAQRLGFVSIASFLEEQGFQSWEGSETLTKYFVEFSSR